VWRILVVLMFLLDCIWLCLLSQLLNESEATVLRLTEQASVLKGEIRRLERNQERENAISNMEYLKNIVYKVHHRKVSDAWNYFKTSHLLTVIHLEYGKLLFLTGLREFVCA